MAPAGPEDPKEVGPSGRDRLVATLRVASSFVPYAGPILGEIINEVIPGRRAERLETYVLSLARRLEALESSGLQDRIKGPVAVDLFEDGALQAVSPNYS